MGFWGNVTDFINKIANELFQAILLLLPDSPFNNIQFPPEIESFLGYLNYYVPFSEMVVIGLGWTTCVGIYYGYQLILRFIQAVR